MKNVTSKTVALHFIYLFLFVMPFIALGQSSVDFKKTFQKADNFLVEQNYFQALPLFLQLDSITKENANLNFKIGMCYLFSKTERTLSVSFLEKAVSNISENYKEGNVKEKKAPVIALFYLGQSYHLDYKFDKAIEVFKTFKPYVLNNPAILKDLDRAIEMCNNGKAYFSAPVKIDIKNLGEMINSRSAEYAPVISADESTLIFTSRRPGSTGGKLDEFGVFYEDIYISQKENDEWTKPVSISPNINTDGHEASIGLSVDGQKLFIYKDDNGDGNIYTSSLEGDQWTTPKKLSDNINSKEWEPSASISADGNTLYFTSDRKGGLGGRDIYKSKRLPNGEWGMAMNLGPNINTSYDDDGPFIHPDGKTLFFSSKGHTSMGGFDVFFSMMNDDKQWEKPFNIGYPINTPDDDIFYFLSADGRRAYYSSFQEGGFGEKDLYQATFIEQKEIPLALIKGTVIDAFGNVPQGVEIIVTDNETGEIAGIYIPNAKTGNYLFILPPGANYNVSYEAEGFLFRSENIDIPDDASYFEVYKAIELAPIQVGQKIVLNNIFFDFNKATLRDVSKVELGKLLKLMEMNPALSVEISGHTDHKGTDAYNEKLSQERAQAVVDYIVASDINKDRFQAKGYGKTNPIAPNTNPDGSDNEEGMQLNRRVELKILGIVLEDLEKK